MKKIISYKGRLALQSKTLNQSIESMIHRTVAKYIRTKIYDENKTYIITNKLLPTELRNFNSEVTITRDVRIEEKELIAKATLNNGTINITLHSKINNILKLRKITNEKMKYIKRIKKMMHRATYEYMLKKNVHIKTSIISRNLLNRELAEYKGSLSIIRECELNLKKHLFTITIKEGEITFEEHSIIYPKKDLITQYLKPDNNHDNNGLIIDRWFKESSSNYPTTYYDYFSNLMYHWHGPNASKEIKVVKLRVGKEGRSLHAFCIEEFKYKVVIYDSYGKPAQENPYYETCISVKEYIKKTYGESKEIIYALEKQTQTDSGSCFTYAIIWFAIINANKKEKYIPGIEKIDPDIGYFTELIKELNKSIYLYEKGDILLSEVMDHISKL